MAKLRFDKDAIQGFFFRHTEKLVLGLVLVLFVLFIWAGSGIAGLDASKTPDQLQAKVEQARQKIEATDKATYQDKPEFAPVETHEDRVKLATQPTAADPYALPTPTVAPRNLIVRRKDPEILKAQQGEVSSVVGPLALMLGRNKVSPYDALENMEQATIEVKKPKPRPSRKDRDKKGSDEEGMSSMMSSSAMMEQMGGDEDEKMSSSKMMSSGGGMGGMMGSGGGSTSVEGEVRAAEERFIGYRPPAAGGASGSGIVPRSLNIVSVRFLFPAQQQWDNFMQTFMNTEDYNPQRDAPRYLSFRAQRAIAPADPNEEPKWEPVNKWFWTEEEMKKPTKYGFVGAPGEIADMNYLHPKLTMPLPPLMMRDPSDLALHSLVPMRKIVKKETSTNESNEPVTIDPTEIGSEGGAPGTPGAPGSGGPSGAGPGTTSGMMSGPGMSSGMMSGAGGGDAMMKQGMSAMGGDTGGDTGGESEDGMMSGGMSSGMMSGGMSSGMMSGGMSSGMMSGGGMSSGGGMMGGGMMGGAASPKAEFYMIRFFDYIGSGTKYIYRVQVLIEDPNRPENPQEAPHDSVLDQTVRERLVKVAADEQANGRRKFYLTSEWSDPTPPIFAETKRNTYAGATTVPDRPLEIKSATGGEKTGYTVPSGDVQAKTKVMSVTWNTKYATEVPGIVDASRGSFLSFVTSVDIIEPVSLIYKTIKEYRLSSKDLVVDLRGGDVIPDPGDAPTTLRAPGEVAIVDDSGNLIVRNELDDWEAFDLLAPPPPLVVEAEDSKSSDEDDSTMGSMFGTGS